jgi:hypothetical protein
MPERYGPLGESWEDAGRTAQRAEHVLEGINTLRNRMLLSLVLKERIPDVRETALRTLEARLDELDAQQDGLVDDPLAAPNAQQNDPTVWRAMWAARQALDAED